MNFLSGNSFINLVTVIGFRSRAFRARLIWCAISARKLFSFTAASGVDSIELVLSLAGQDQNWSFGNPNQNVIESAILSDKKLRELGGEVLVI